MGIKIGTVEMQIWQILSLALTLTLMFPLPLVLSAIEVNVDYGDPRLDEFLNMCIDSKYHKIKPGPEDSLHNQCAPWANRSCCVEGTTVDLHYQKMYNFDRNHCSHVKPLSAACDKHFRQDLCFYECSPNVGPWTVQVNNSFRRQRFYKVPLCLSDCQSWFDDCADDMTCTDNWPQNMDFIKGMGNRCPRGSSCKTFREIYRTPQYFCSVVWDHSWEVVDDDQHCMRLWFDPSGGNPNDAVALWKAKQLLKQIGNKTPNSASGNSGSNSVIFATFLLLSGKLFN